jgi:acetylornithine/N-succinyldiaminopimelate aminotransferase
MTTLTETEPAQEISLAQQIMDRDKQFVLGTYARYPLVLKRGRGCYLYDVNGKRYLDLLSGIGVNALGHANPRLVKVIREQAALMMHCSNLYYHEWQGKLAERMVKVSGLEKAFLCNSGTEAIEGALKMVRAHGGRIDPDKYEIVALENSFHGRTLGALSITGQPKYRKDFEPLLPGVKFVRPDDVEGLEAAVSDRTAGIVFEWIQGEGGVYPISDRMTRKAKELTEKHNALLVCDEIQCGVGRTGAYFAYQLASPAIMPDVAVTAKPLGNGIPIGVIMTGPRATPAISPGMHGTTFGGGALACRTALECMDLIEDLLPNIRKVGAYFSAQLKHMTSKFAFVKEVRGQGLMIGIELTIPGKQMVLDAMEDGLLINCTHDTVIRMLPPFLITEKQVDAAVRGLRKVFVKALAHTPA